MHEHLMTMAKVTTQRFFFVAGTNAVILGWESEPGKEHEAVRIERVTR
jgi:hypothetical protein